MHVYNQPHQLTNNKSKFKINYATAYQLSQKYGTPLYLYDYKTLVNNATKAKSFPSPGGLTVRFAIKSCPNSTILQAFLNAGLHFDASSGNEVHRAINYAKIPPNKISLSTQELPNDIYSLVNQGIQFNACSLHQLRVYGKLFSGSKVGIRINPGLGSGHSNKTNVAGLGASFGIWYKYLEEIKSIANEYDLTIVRIHFHIGSGGKSSIWKETVISKGIELLKEFPNASIFNIGGGYLPNADFKIIGIPIKKAFAKFCEQQNRNLNIEIEPGTFLVANAGILLTKVQDIAKTFENGYHRKDKGHTFIKLNAGMTEIMRPTLYAAQHNIYFINDRTAEIKPKEVSKPKYVIVGHCCESGDLLTPSPDSSEELAEREFDEEVNIGDFCVIERTGAYCSSMSAKNYNSFPEAAEVLIKGSDSILIRRRQTISQIVQNEILAKL